MQNLFFCWLSTEFCPHQKVPIETDESMTPTSLDLVWPSWCNQCNSHTETSKRQQGHGCEPQGGAPRDDSQLRPSASQLQHESRAVCQADPQFHFIPRTHSGQMNPPNLAGDRCHSVTDQAVLYEWDHMGIQRQGLAGPSSRFNEEEAEYLEPPLPLMSSMNYFHPSQYPAAGTPAQCVCLPAEI